MKECQEVCFFLDPFHPFEGPCEGKQLVGFQQHYFMRPSTEVDGNAQGQKKKVTQTSGMLMKEVFKTSEGSAVQLLFSQTHILLRSLEIGESGKEGFRVFHVGRSIEKADHKEMSKFT